MSFSESSSGSFGSGNQLPPMSRFEVPPFKVSPLPEDVRSSEDSWQMVVAAADSRTAKEIDLFEASIDDRLSFARIVPDSLYPEDVRPEEATQMSLEDIIVTAREHARNFEYANVLRPGPVKRVFIIDADRTRIRQVREDEPNPTILIPDFIPDNL